MALLSRTSRRTPRRLALAARWGTWLALGLLAFSSPRPAAAAPPAPEYQLKAVFLFNFAQFVEWPDAAFAQPDSPLVIGVLGTDPFDGYLDDLVKGEKVGVRPIAIRRYSRIEQVSGCHILFVCASEARNVTQIVAALKGRSILSVSDIDRFAMRGGVVRFAREEGKIRLRINLEAAKAAGLTISSKILRPEMIVVPGGD